MSFAWIVIEALGLYVLGLCVKVIVGIIKGVRNEKSE